MRFKLGEKVMAKWPGSGLYYHAEIKEIDEDEEVAGVIFEDGTEMNILLKEISRPEKILRRKRSKSPARLTRRRSKSPGRSPGRPTGSKTEKDGVIKKRVRSSSRSRKLPSLTSSSSSSVEEKEVKVTVKSLSPKVVSAAGGVIATKSNTLITETKVSESRYMVTRQRLSDQKKINKVSAELPPASPKPTETKEFGGVLGTFLIYLTVPILPIIIIIGCSEKSCNILQFKMSMVPCNLEAYYDPMSIMMFIAFMLFHAVIYALPFGHIIQGPTTPSGHSLPYRINAMYHLVFTVAAYAALYHLKYPLTLVHDKMFTIAVAAAVFSYAATFLSYMKSLKIPKDQVNPKADTGSPIYDSFMGHEMHPRIGSLFDLKLYLYRPSMAGWLVVVMVELQRAYESNTPPSPQLLVVGVSQILYIIYEFFLDEEQCPFMFDIKNEGLGFVQFYGELVLVPFVYSLPTRFVVDHPDEISVNALVTSITLIVVGSLFIVVSGIQKNRFRKNPYDPSLSHLESLPASRPGGYRLLVSGLWGVVRHPNYLGEIFMGLGWSFACGFTHLLPWWYPVFLTVLLCHRALRSDHQCQEKHGHTWKEYCRRVKYRVIPYVF